MFWYYRCYLHYLGQRSTLTQNFKNVLSHSPFGWTMQQAHHLLGPQNAIGSEHVSATLSYDYLEQESSFSPAKQLTRIMSTPKNFVRNGKLTWYWDYLACHL